MEIEGLQQFPGRKRVEGQKSVAEISPEQVAEFLIFIGFRKELRGAKFFYFFDLGGLGGC
jgi:hypothetical protein